MKRSKALLFVPAFVLIGLTTSLGDALNPAAPGSAIAYSSVSASATDISPAGSSVAGTDRGGLIDDAVSYDEASAGLAADIAAGLEP